MTLLLTLAIQSLNPLINEGKQDVLEVPSVASDKLGLRGVVVDDTHLSGWTLDSYDKFRNNADKAKSPCLLVRDNTLTDFIDSHVEARERIQRLSVAANRLGCNAIAITPTFPDDQNMVNQIVEQLRDAMVGVERLELNLLLQPTDGLSSNPDELIEIIKQIGGFRIGALPTFSSASKTGNGIEALQKLAPYAGGIVADFPTGRGKKHIDPYEGLQAICDVGYSNTIALNYVGKGDAMKEINKVATKMRSFLGDNK
ncbi:MAG: hypothetical protein QF718_05530 [Phycisphaerales bacterium]|jgi:hypothetical protein|nr:hypothetical protein [Phycisphaerales bacterium]